MKSQPDLIHDDDDIFGPPRSYSASYYSATRQRPSMISAKYRQKEERRKVLKISVNKLRRIEDPEAWLCRSVLINNTMKRLQKEAKEEKGNQQKKVVSSDFAIHEDLIPSELYEKKRPAEEEECDVQDVLSQFYMPPTPRMLTSIDEDEELLPEAKRPRLEEEDKRKEETRTPSSLPTTVPVTTASSFSCGHASMFSDLQTNVFHSLVASLET